MDINFNNSPQEGQPVVAESGSKRWIWVVVSVLILVVFGVAAFFTFKQPAADVSVGSDASFPVAFQEPLVNVPFVRQQISINPAVAQTFSTSEIKNIPDVEKAYGFTFSPQELAQLEQNKFVTKNLLDTNITGRGLVVGDDMREMVALYREISGDSDYKNRTPANAVFISADSMMNLFSILSADLLKETENKYLYGETLAMTKTMYDQASANLQHAKSEDEKKQWQKVRDYFAVPYALLSTSMQPISAENYTNSDYAKKGLTVDEAQADFEAKDKDADSYEKIAAFVQNLKLDAADESAVLSDLKQAYEATAARGVPQIFAAEYDASAKNIQVTIPFTLFKPRGTYTSSSLRREYFRAVQWYQQVPFLLGSKDLTSYAVDIGQLVQADATVADQYKKFSSLIAFIVGESDDLDVSDYAAAVQDLGDNVKDQKALAAYLQKRKPDARIKSLPVNIDPAAPVTVEDEMLAARGMRFMSQKFIPDSYWTSQLTQGDEVAATKNGPLPDKASVLEVMSILGSPYATSHLPDLPFYAGNKQAVDTKLAQLSQEAHGWSEGYWKSNLYTSTLWSLSGMFDWLSANRATLPQFMQSPLWDAKTLLTAAGFWTELRHTSILYAKQSFAEKGGGGDDSCDLRKVPPPAEGYVEPQAESYDRLYYTAQRLAAEYKARGFDLRNLPQLANYITLLNTVREYTKLELENTTFSESTITKARKTYEGADCTEYFISPDSAVHRSDDSYTNPVSRWEELRVALIDEMRMALPVPVEGPIIQIKDKRAAVVADVHTDKDGGILEEGTGVPRVIFVAVKDANGPRLTVGFTYSQYETISDERLTDEDWQNRFYSDSGSDYLITYNPKTTWPSINPWFQELLGGK
jgi:hypothetical protein